MNKRISIKDCILFAVNALLSHPWYLLKLFVYWLGGILVFLAAGITLVVASAWILNPIAIHLVGDDFSVDMINPVMFGIWNLLVAFIFAYIVAAVWFMPTPILLDFNGRSFRYFTFRSLLTALSFKTILRLIGAGILCCMAIMGGLLLVIIPGIYLFVKLQFTFYNIIDEKMGVIEAMRKSYRMTTGNFGPLLGLILICYVLNGLIILLPVVYLISIRAYKKLK